MAHARAGFAPAALKALSNPASPVRRHGKGTQPLPANEEKPMRCMVIVKATPESEANPPVMPSTELLAAMDGFNQELLKAGVLLAGEGLRPSRDGKRVRLGNGQHQVTDGPFAETKELVAGFWLWQVRSMDEALAWASRCPPPFEGGGVLEIRPLYEAADFGEALTPELRESEERLRAELATKPR